MIHRRKRRLWRKSHLTSVQEVLPESILQERMGDVVIYGVWCLIHSRPSANVATQQLAAIMLIGEDDSL